jgi:hypothetical protein
MRALALLRFGRCLLSRAIATRLREIHGRRRIRFVYGVAHAGKYAGFEWAQLVQRSRPADQCLHHAREGRRKGSTMNQGFGPYGVVSVAEIVITLTVLTLAITAFVYMGYQTRRRQT